MIRQKGFSLIEIAIALLILSLMIASFSGIFKLVFDTDHIMEERANIDRIKRSLNMYLHVNLYLPCPDVDGDGREDRTSGICDAREGYLPFNDIGVDEKDAWGNPYYYRIHQRASGSSAYKYINDICEPASVFGSQGGLDRIDESTSVSHLTYCPETATYYCEKLSDIPTSACSGGTMTDDTDPRTVAAPPYFHLVTPPYGDVTGSYNIIVNDEFGNELDAGVVALVLSWGANGGEVYRYSTDDPECGHTTTPPGEIENCNKDRFFVDTQTGENRDLLSWVTVSQAKLSLVTQPAD